MAGKKHLDHLRARNLRPNYIDARERILRRLTTAFGDPLTASLADLRMYLDFDRDLKPGSRATEIAHLRGFYQWALLEGHIKSDPTIRLERPKLDPGKPRPIASSDLAAAFAAANDLTRPMLYLAAYAGLRACEIGPLRGEHLLLDAEPRLLLIVEGKGGIAGTVPMSTILVDALATLPREGWLFPRIDGRDGNLSRYRVCQLCNGLLHRLEINATLHQLRHWFGTETYRATLDLRLTQRLMRHRSSRDTERYTYIADADAAAAVDRLPRLT